MLHKYLFAALLLAASVSCGNMEIYVWDTEDCTGEGLKSKKDLELNVGCIRRGDVSEQFELEHEEGKQRDEKAISAYQDGSIAAQSQTLVFFTSEDCDPSTEIEGKYVDDGCSNGHDELKGDKWKSYEMRDACYGGLSGCDLDEGPQEGPIQG